MKINSVIKTFKTYRNAFVYYLIYLGFLRKKQVMLKIRNGLKFYVRPRLHDHYSVNGVFLDKEYDIAFASLNKSESIVFDIGAHIGAFSIPASVNSYKVYAYEPNKESYKLLLKNIKLNRRQNIIPKSLGIAQKSGRHQFFISQKSSLSHSLIRGSDKQHQTKIIKCVTLQSEIERNKIQEIALLKLDCEGAEFQILMSLNEKLFKSIKHIVLEYHNHLDKKYTVDSIIKILKRHDYTVKIIKIFGKRKGLLFASRKLK